MVLVLSLTLLESSIFSRENIFTNILVNAGHASYATYLSHLYVVEGLRKFLLSVFLVGEHNAVYVLFILLFLLTAGKLLYIIYDKPISDYVKKFLLSRL